MAGGDTRIHLCGRLQVEWHGERVESALRGRQGRLLFVYLVLNRSRPVRRDELASAVWPDEMAAGGEALLAPLLSRLRRIIGAAHLEGRSELTLVLPAGAWVDTEALRAEVSAARAAVDAGAWPAAAASAGRALEIAERGLLPGIEAPWIDELRRQHAETRVEVLELVAQAGVGAGGAALPGAVQAARAAIEAAPFRESAHAALLRGLRAQGNVAEALRAYEELRMLLREELGTAPSRDLAALHEELLRADEAPAPPAPAPEPAPPAPTVPPAPPPPRTGGPDLVERDRELRQLGALLAEASAGEGRVALIEGPAGVGKTRLLAEARRRAARAETVVLYARAGELEREFPFGVVRQLLEEPLADPERRRALLAGAATPAAAVFDEGGDAGGGADATFAVLHGLFWVALNLAADRPLMLAVDDLHWCDRPSLRFLAYLVRRLEGLPVLVAVTLRTGEQPADALLLDEILHDPATIPVRPGPLSVAAVRVVVRARLGTDAAEAFCAACHETTGGNPLLLRQLLAALEADGIEPVQAGVPIVREIGPRAVSRSIALRLGRLSPDTVAAARAVAVLGEGAKVPAVAALAGLSVEDAGTAIGRLAQAEVLRAEPPLGFVHPLVRDAVYLELPVGERELRHAAAARVLADAGSPPDEAAVHLLVAPPRGDAWAAETLLAAGRAAGRRGAADGAVAFLRRALAEPPPPALRSELLLELGILEQAVDGPAAVVHLRAAYDELTDPESRGRAAFALGWTMFFVASPPETIEFAERASAELPPEHADLAYALEAVEFVARLAWGFTREDIGRLRGRREAPPPGDGPGAKMLMAITAFDWAIDGGPLDRCVALVQAALEGGGLIVHDNGLFIPAVASVLSWADHPDALAVWDAPLAEAHRRGSLFLTLTVHLWRARTLFVRGELAEAESSLRAGIDELTLWGSGAAVQGYPAAFLGHALLARGGIDEAWAILDLSNPPVGSDPDALVAIAKADVLLAEGRPAAALAALEPLMGAYERHHQPAWMPWRSTLARCLAGVERTQEAVALADEELDLARRWGAPATLGRVLRIRGTLPGAEDLALVEEAVAVLEPSYARLERAYALAALGTGLHARGDDIAARPPLQRALDLAEACDARGLAEECRAGLEAAGGAPRAASRAGVAALTQLERRVAALASTGDDPRAIAQAIFLTPREAEAHLDAARRKLGVEDPADLGRALAGAGV